MHTISIHFFKIFPLSQLFYPAQARLVIVLKVCRSWVWLPIVKSTNNRWINRADDDNDEDKSEVGWSLLWAPGFPKKDSSGCIMTSPLGLKSFSCSNPACFTCTFKKQVIFILFFLFFFLSNLTLN